MAPNLIDLTKPRWDQSTYWGRATHFFYLTNPLNVLASDKELDEAQNVVTEFKKTKIMPSGYDEEKLWAAKYLYDSAFHPDTGEKMVLIGRMAAQAPMNTLITGGMITFYRTTAATVFWQWLNQTFNAIVNYTNRSGDTPIPLNQMLASYCCACGGALGTALYLNSKVKNMNPLFARFVPFAAVAGANCLNIPMMRSSELINGTPVFTPAGERIGESQNAARYGISLVVISRIFMAIPGMILTPVATEFGQKRGWFRGGRHWLILPFQLASVGFCVTVATPLGCAMFPQQATLPVSRLEPELAKIARSKNVDRVVYNKVMTPIVTNMAMNAGWFTKNPALAMPFQLGLVALCVTIATPLGCALFVQQADISTSWLEPHLEAIAKKRYVNYLTFNKGL